MDKKKIAFVGEPCCEVVLYLGQILDFLGYELNVYDLSPLKDIASIVPNVNFADGVAEYMGLNVVWAGFDSVPTEEYSLFYFGYNVGNPLIASCDEVWMFTDYQLQHINALKRVAVGTLPRFLVYMQRDVGRTEARFIMNEFAFMQINDDNFVEVDAASDDFRFRCQYNNVVKFGKGAKLLPILIRKLLEVDFDNKEINAAIKGVK